jgi:predicted nucleic acid-binding protein
MRAALYSKDGASFKLITKCNKGLFEVALSVPVCFEYEDIFDRCADIAEPARNALIEYIISIAVLQDIFFLWRAESSDPKDDMFLELAIRSRASVIVTYNKRDFSSTEKFGIRSLTPLEFLKEIGVL